MKMLLASALYNSAGKELYDYEIGDRLAIHDLEYLERRYGIHHILVYICYASVTASPRRLLTLISLNPDVHFDFNFNFDRHGRSK